MDGKDRNLVGIASVGGSSKTKLLHKVETLRFIFHDFKNRKEKRGEFMLTPALNACGYPWMLLVFPRGAFNSSADVGKNVSCFLKYVGDSNRKPTVGVAIRCKGYKTQFEEANTCIGWPNYINRENILDNYLDEDGSLVIEIDLQISTSSDKVWYPKEFQQHAILNKIYRNSSETADVVFVVEGKEYYAHKNILSCRALALFDLCQEYEGEQQSIPISGIKGETFEEILMFVYTVKLPNIEDATSAVELLLTADRFGCTDLKLYVESIITDRFLSVTNAASMLILGDSHSCALLKAAAMDLHASDMNDVMESEDWPKVEESNRLLAELLKSAGNKLAASKNVNAVEYDVNANLLNVTTLRGLLEDTHLEVDGSLEIIVERLKNLFSPEAEAG